MGCCGSCLYRASTLVSYRRKPKRRPWRRVFLTEDADILEYSGGFHWVEAPKASGRPLSASHGAQWPQAGVFAQCSQGTPNITGSLHLNDRNECSNDDDNETPAADRPVEWPLSRQLDRVSRAAARRRDRTLEPSHCTRRRLQNVASSSSSSTFMAHPEEAGSVTESSLAEAAHRRGLFQECPVTERVLPCSRDREAPHVPARADPLVPTESRFPARTPEWRRWLREHPSDAEDDGEESLPPVVRRLEFADQSPG
jgi:hypothetical protein